MGCVSSIDIGTWLEPLGAAVRYGAGHVIVHPGAVRHGGEPVTRGVRYALVCFCEVRALVITAIAAITVITDIASASARSALWS